MRLAGNLCRLEMRTESGNQEVASQTEQQSSQDRDY